MKKSNKQMTSNTEMVSISRAEYESLKNKLAQAELQNDWLLEQLKLLKKKQFGKSTEQAGESVMEQLNLLFNEAEAIDGKSVEEVPSKAKAKSSAGIYSIIETAKENNLNPYRYLLWIFQTAPTLAQTDENWADSLLPSMARRTAR